MSELTSEIFSPALCRFTFRRRKCLNIYSDNGTNFVGASKDLCKQFDILKSKSKVWSKENQLALIHDLCPGPDGHVCIGFAPIKLE